jgi:hypothetical protein
MKTYELPIAREYVHNWGVEDAVREIMQNAVDSQTDGHPLSVSYSNGTLAISNLGCSLDISSLVLGNGTKHDTTKYIGNYGEGFKLAIIVLLRNSIGVSIFTQRQAWTPQFRQSTKFKVETLHIDVTTTDVNNAFILFELTGIDQDLFDKLRENSLAMSKAMGYSIGEVIETEYGNILLEPRYKGKMFVNGLYVETDSSFQYGYDFKPEFLHLDRDRRAISYYKMRELTAKAMTSQPNVRLVHTAIQKSYTDVRDTIDYMDNISKEFKVNFAKEFITSHNLDEDTFVGTEKEVLVSTSPKKFKTQSRVLAELVNAGQGNEVEYAKIKKQVNELSKQEEAEVSFHGSDFESMVLYLCEHKDVFDIDDLIEEIKSWTDLHTSNFKLIADKILDEIFYESEVEEND